MREEIIYWQTGQPDELVKEPVLIKLNGAFKWGLQYKVPDDEGNKVWKMTDDIIEWAEIA